MCDSLPARGIRELVPLLPALGESGCFCVTFKDRVIFSDAMQQRNSVWSVLHCSPQIHETHIWGEFQLFCWVSLRGLVGRRVRPCVVQSLWLWLWCCPCHSVPLCDALLRLRAFVSPALSILSTSCSGQRLLGVT